MARRDYASKKSHIYKSPRRVIRRDKLRREVAKKRWLVLLKLIVLSGFFICIFYWLFFSPLFMVNNRIEVRNSVAGQGTHEGLNNAIREALSGRVWKVVPRGNFFFIQPNQLAVTLSARTDLRPLIYNLAVVKIWPNKLIITYKSRVAVWRVEMQERLLGGLSEPADISRPTKSQAEKAFISTGQSFLIDAEGVMVLDGSLSTNDQKRSIKIVPIHLVGANIDTKVKWQPGMTVLDRELVSNLAKLLNFWTVADKQGLLGRIDYFEVDSKIKDTVVVVGQGRRVYFNLGNSLQRQINNLSLTLERIGTRKNLLQYIDLRIDSRSYACCNLGVF
ncbi:MAG: hypothetical protein A2445_04070 [Candidatus Jacksonbacteria bacterium RIFOXYC2_FULL_44_29]|nr:MAG: hypothetical protein UV19_C0001G0041 [Parcubacteria group bacterium GW2011_GWA2_42_28]KKT56236.1 MAG: hypothetical protein UW45_C0001G0040 [Parcubacteria group bacterium GW2011_GWC2_44_22]OGY76116.1 MAG: hypothetical protein A2240_00290 [Candidatus Jacksonbacteria bacterium RIFOXYA2_FULL_43_12]OGY77707.1 MAG: hypothetical protein A2295_02790 [Candidatus Jacksonbacteria bacterium RIFOXYB2_FULL_44_15]OGY78843.1 MAG: hypothetical protein A2550_04855 [Candidatus Jacksonbacteria bacterium RI